jgi:Calcineurin-like phosphoesterase
MVSHRLTIQPLSSLLGGSTALQTLVTRLVCLKRAALSLLAARSATPALLDDALWRLKLREPRPSAIRAAWRGLLALGALGVAGCGGGGSSSTPPVGPSRTGLIVSDIHFNPLADPTLANRLAQAPASQWDSILATSTKTNYFYTDTVQPYGKLIGDTNFPLLQSVLAAMRKRVPNPDIVFVSGDFLAHGLPASFNNAFPNIPQSAAKYVAFVNTTEQYLAMKLAQTFPNAQIVPALGDWDTPCASSDTYPGTGFLASFSSAWNAALNRHGGAPDFQATFVNNGGSYSTTFPIDPRGRLIVLDTQHGCQARHALSTLRAFRNRTDCRRHEPGCCARRRR